MFRLAPLAFLTVASHPHPPGRAVIMGVLRDLYRNWLVAQHSPAHWRLRPRTIDRRIFRHVVIDNEYALPDRFHPDDTILDIGGHVGSFSLAALRRGAGMV